MLATVFFVLLVPSYQSSTQTLCISFVVVGKPCQIFTWSIPGTFLNLLGTQSMSICPAAGREKWLRGDIVPLHSCFIWATYK